MHNVARKSGFVAGVADPGSPKACYATGTTAVSARGYKGELSMRLSTNKLQERAKFRMIAHK
jgi:hypothetical protein